MPRSAPARFAAVLTAAAATLGTTVMTANAVGAACVTTTPLTLLNFNDFHGRLARSSPNTVQFVGTLEEQRALAGEANTLVLSAGDSVGASLFASFAQNDEPTLDLLNAMDVAASAVGNHELDQGFSDLTGRIAPGVEFPYLAANLYLKGTTTPAVPAYTVVTKNGLRVGIVGAVTSGLSGLVSPAGIATLDVGDPVQAVNHTIADLKDGNEANGEADVIVVEYHEGAGVGSTPTAGIPASTLAEQLTASPLFADLVTNTDPRAQVIFNGHTHQVYAWDGAVPGGTRPVLQAGSYASNVGKVSLVLDAATGATCSYTQAVLPMSATPVDTLVATYPRVAAAKVIVDKAVDDAAVIGNRVIGTAAAPITRAKTTGNERGLESTLSNMIAQMFKDTLGTTDPNFIGMQNPGGTRADIAAGPITYGQAAGILPFANTLMTTELTGTQLKKVLEQQWQTKADGTPLGGSRPVLMLGLSSNVTFTYDASLPWGSRITSVRVSGRPLDPAGTYTVGSGSFLIAGGDQFWEIAKGANPTDTGRADLEAWVEWISGHTAPLAPSFAKQGVSVHVLPTLILGDTGTTFSVGVPQDTAALDTLNFTSTGFVANTTLVATVEGYKSATKSKAKVPNGTVIGSASVVDGKVTAITVYPPKGAPKGSGTLVLTAPDSGTVIKFTVYFKELPKA